ncbi:tetratricopeptide repeat protein [Kitasatospora sp. NPDC006697]|uniref:tetratricopeptide repeat protein n=1 Tax=Kitasatospora sp. NPDC006697 TaxID=3364020 RepID=UPI003683A111
MGTAPALASAFQQRPDLRERIDQARATHSTVVLTQVLSGGGGVGKTQFAADYAHRAHTTGIDVIVWINAAETQQVITTYATAAQHVQAPGASGQDPETDARAFLRWLATTNRTWLVVLDDLTDVRGCEPWWPQPPSATGNGRVLATTRRRDALVSGHGRAVIDVSTYTEAEALAYLSDRFAGAGMDHLLDEETGAVIDELGQLPLALGHAAAYMINEQVACARYLALLTERRSSLQTLLPPEADTEGYGRQVTASLLLALDAAQQREPVGLAVPALRLAARLDPAGHPESLWSTEAVTGYLTELRTVPQERPVSPEEARAVLRLLHRYALVTLNPKNGHRAVRVHALTARAARETTPAADTRAAVRVGADALFEIWPEEDYSDFNLAAVLRANTEALAAEAGDDLWQPDGHPALYRMGKSLLQAGLDTAAVSYWHVIAGDAQRLLGQEHADSLSARSLLAFSYWQARRTDDAITIEEQVLADYERMLGPKHPNALTARTNLAASYRRAGRTDEAITLLEQVLADRERIQGDKHPSTITARANLAACYWQVGRTDEAITIDEQVIIDRERFLGHKHPSTILARANLAACYRQAGRTGEAITLLEQVLADYEQQLGHEHPDTLNARTVLAAYHQQAAAVRKPWWRSIFR